MLVYALLWLKLNTNYRLAFTKLPAGLVYDAIRYIYVHSEADRMASLV